MCCIAPGCTSNYWGEVHFTTVFCFPKDIEVRDKCFRAIPGPREDYQSNKNPKASNVILFSSESDAGFEIREPCLSIVYNLYIYMCVGGPWGADFAHNYL